MDTARKVARNRNGGLRKRCACPRKQWSKCPHSWHLNFKPRGGRHWRISIDTELGRHVESKTEAAGIADHIRTRIRNGTFRSTVGTGRKEHADVPTFRSYVDREWMPSAVLNLKASTIRYYKDNLENHLFPVLGDRPVSEVNRRDCRAVVSIARGKGLRIQTVRGIIRTLGTVLSKAVEDDLLAANPSLCMRKYLRRGDEAEPRMNPFTREESAAIIDAAKEHSPTWHAWILCGLRTGMRPSELLGLQWSDIDWHGRFISVERSIVRGKLTTPKNHQTRRVDMSSQLRAILRLLRRRAARKWMALGLPRPVWVFASELGSALDESNARKAFNQVLDKAGLHRRGPHQMRHTFASLLLQAGEPITYVSRQLGHKDASVTLRVYAHWLPDASIRRGVERLDSPAVAQSLHRGSPVALARTA